MELCAPRRGLHDTGNVKTIIDKMPLETEQPASAVLGPASMATFTMTSVETGSHLLYLTDLKIRFKEKNLM